MKGKLKIDDIEYEGLSVENFGETDITSVYREPENCEYPEILLLIHGTRIRVNHEFLEISGYTPEGETDTEDRPEPGRTYRFFLGKFKPENPYETGREDKNTEAREKSVGYRNN